MHFLEHNQAFPDHEELLPHFHAEIAQHKVDLQALDAEEDIAQGWKSEFLYRTRFNLSDSAWNLLDTDPPDPVPVPYGGPFPTAWRNYMKSVFKKGLHV